MKFGILLKLLFVAALFNTATADVCYRNPVTNGTATVIGTTGNSVTIEFNLEALESKEVYDAFYGTGTIFRIPGSGLTANTGYPDLPAVRRMVEVSDYGEVEVEILDRETISLGNYTIPPFQPLQIRNLPALHRESQEVFCPSTMKS